MDWFDSGHTDPAPRGETVEIRSHTIGEVFNRFGITRILNPRPEGLKTTGDPNGRRD